MFSRIPSGTLMFSRTTSRNSVRNWLRVRRSPGALTINMFRIGHSPSGSHRLPQFRLAHSARFVTVTNCLAAVAHRAGFAHEKMRVWCTTARRYSVQLTTSRSSCSGSGCRKSTARCRRGRGCLARWFVRSPFEHQLYQRPMQQIPGSPHATILYLRHDVLPRCRTKLGFRCGIGQSSPIWLWRRNASDYIMNICPISNNSSSQPTPPRDPGIRRAFSSPASMVTTSSARSSSPVGAGSLTPSWPRSVELAPGTAYSTSVVRPGVRVHARR
jgi:hypothetical protein